MLALRLLISALLAFFACLVSETCAEVRPQPVASTDMASRTLSYAEITKEFEELKEFPDGRNRRSRSVWLMNEFSVFLIEQGEWYLAGPLLESAAELCPEADVALRNHIAVTTASFRYLDGHLEEAEQTFRRMYLETAGDSSEIQVHIRLAINFGEVNQQAGKKKEALGYFNRAAAMADSIGSHFLYANAVIHAERLEDNDRVQLAMLEKCIKAVYEGDCSSLAAPAYLALARYRYRQGDDAEAIKEIDRACAAAKKLGQLKYETEGLQLWGQIYARQNNPTMSYTCMQRLVDLREAALRERERSSALHAAAAAEILEWSAGESSGNSRWLIGLCILLALLLLSGGITGWILWRINRRNRPSADSDETEHLTNELENLRARLGETTEEARKLEMLYRGFGSMTRRVRQTLRGIKGDASEQQAKIKELSSYMLQNALPERRNALLKAMEEDDARFIAALEQRTGTQLSTADRNLALCLCHGLNTQEIACITGVLPKSVNQNRYRLRRVLGLEQEDDLEKFLISRYREANSDVDNKSSEISDN